MREPNGPIATALGELALISSTVSHRQPSGKPSPLPKVDSPQRTTHPNLHPIALLEGLVQLLGEPSDFLVERLVVFFGCLCADVAARPDAGHLRVRRGNRRRRRGSRR